MDFIIAIPTLNRYKTITNKTLAALIKEGFLAAHIFLFVSSEQQRNLYLAEVPRNLYNEIIVGELGIANQRNFINKYFSEGTRILYCDDDLRGFKKLRGFESLHIPSLVSMMFDFCIQKNSLLFGFQPACNPLFFKPKIRNTLQLICGSCFGMISTHSLLSSGSCKVDYKLSFEAYKKTNNLLRIDLCSPITTYWKGAGGLVDTRTTEIESLAARNLLDQYPEYVKEVFVKKNGRPDLKLRSFPKLFIPVKVDNDDRTLLAEEKS